VESESLPLVSVVIPMRNEERYIGRCLESLAGQDYPRQRLEVIVVDGESSDGSRQVVDGFGQGALPGLRLLSNPIGTTPRGLNIGIQEAGGDVIIVLGAHSEVEPSFLGENVRALLDSDADCVGGPITSVGDGLVGGAIALAMSSPFGVGDALFRYSRRRQWVETVAFGAYRREVFQRIGLFAEDLVGDEDTEFHYRLAEAGGKILLTPEIKSVYYPRSSLAALFRQYLSYGSAKVKVARRYPHRLRLRALVPGAFVATLAVSGALAILHRRAGWLFGLVAGSYAFASFLVSFAVASRRGWRYLPVLPVVFVCIHFAYGLGFLGGLARLLLSMSLSGAKGRGRR